VFIEYVQCMSGYDDSCIYMQLFGKHKWEDYGPGQPAHKCKTLFTKHLLGRRVDGDVAQVAEHLAGKLIVLSSKSRNSHLDR
jgi:hypothetical protein